MTWTYSAAGMLDTAAGAYPGSTVGMRNQIRFVIQDNKTARQLLDDAEIDWEQTQEQNAYMAAAACCDILVARAGSLRTKKVGDLALTYDPEFYRGLASRLRSRGMTYQVPYCGGISESDKLAQEADTDWVPPSIFRGLLDNPRTTQPTPSNTAPPGYPTT